MEYIVNHENLVSAAEAELLGFKLYQEVTVGILKFKKAEKTEVLLAYDDPIVNDFKAIFESDTKDTIFSLQGEEIKVHKAMLLIQSSELTEYVNEESKKPLAFLTLDQRYCNITRDAFDSMFRFFYYSFHSFDVLHACQLFVFARDMKLTKLSHCIESVLSKRDFSIQSILPILDVAYSPLLNSNPDLQKQLQENGLQYAIHHIDKIDFSSLVQMTPLIGTNVLLLLQQCLSDHWGQISGSTTFTPLNFSEKALKSGSSFNMGSPQSPTKSGAEISEDVSEKSENKKRTLDRKKKNKSASNLNDNKERTLNRKADKAEKEKTKN